MIENSKNRGHIKEMIMLQNLLEVFSQPRVNKPSTIIKFAVKVFYIEVFFYTDISNTNVKIAMRHSYSLSIYNQVRPLSSYILGISQDPQFIVKDMP